MGEFLHYLVVQSLAVRTAGLYLRWPQHHSDGKWHGRKENKKTAKVTTLVLFVVTMACCLPPAGHVFII